MKDTYYQDKKFGHDDIDVTDLSGIEFDSCIFEHCDFTKTDFSGAEFTDCLFENCKLAMTKLDNTSFRNIAFKNTKLIGVDFSNLNDFLLEMNFDTCILDYCVFFKKKLKKIKFLNSLITESQFSECDLSEANFDNCRLPGSLFENTKLEKADFRTAFEYMIDPELNRIRKAKFSIPGVIGLLHKYDIEIEI